MIHECIHGDAVDDDGGAPRTSHGGVDGCRQRTRRCGAHRILLLVVCRRRRITRTRDDRDPRLARC